MATLTGTQIANTYKQLLQVGSGNNGLTASVQTVQDGQGNNSALQLSQSAVNIDGTFQLNGVTLTANASALNNIADLTGATGIIAVSGGSVYGRTLTGGTGVSITNADGTEGNPTIALNPTGVVSASYGPATNIEINSVGQVVSAGAATSVSVSGVTANTFTGGTFAGTTGDFSSNVSVGGNLVLAGQFSPASLSVTGTINAAKISATDATFNSIVSAGFFVGDGSGLVNVPSAEGGTLKAITAGTGIKLTVDAAVTTTIPVSGTVAVSANQNFGSVSVSTALAVTGSALFGIVSATNIDTDELLIAGVSAATVTEVAAVSTLTQTNLDSITSINTIIGDGSNFATSAELAATSLALATSIDTANTRITSVSDFAVALSATLATSIGNSNTNITTNANAITSINTVVANVSAVTSVNAAAITSINTVVANVSALTSVNAAAITSINGVIEGNVSADSGTFNTLTVVTSASVGGTFNVGGNVGIGTSSPDGTLNVQRTAASAGWIINGQTVGVANDSGLFIDSSNNIEVAVRNGSGTLTAAVKSSGSTFFNGGDVGIGTASPATKFHVLDGSSSLRFRQNGTVSETLVVGPSGGDAALYLGDTVDTVRGGLYYDTSENALQIRGYNNSTRIIIDSSGNVGIGTTSPDKQLHITKAAKADIGTLTDGATITPDFDANQNFTVTLGGNRTLANPTNIDAGQTGSIFVVQDGTGSRTLSFGSYWKFAGGTAPTLSTAAGSVDRIDYIVYTTTAIHAVATLNVS